MAQEPVPSAGECADVTVASSRMQVTPSSAWSATRTPGSVAVPRHDLRPRVPARGTHRSGQLLRHPGRRRPLISSSVRYAVGTDATCPNASA